MLIENIMYFALGALAAALLGLLIMPAIWRRAVRLTKRRIEAATPMTMAEFRADKDQLRAEFALSTRRLEMNVEQLRKRLADQLADATRNADDVATMKTDREKHAQIVREFESREADLKQRVLDLERDGTDLGQRLRMRERDLENRNTEILRLRQDEPAGAPAGSAASTDADLATVQFRIASAENRLNAVLAETSAVVEAGSGEPEQSLADKLTLEDELDGLRTSVATVEGEILGDWNTERRDLALLRQRLNDITGQVGRIVHAADVRKSERVEESLFDRVQRFAGNALAEGPTPERASRGSSRQSDRVAARREIQGR